MQTDLFQQGNESKSKIHKTEVKKKVLKPSKVSKKTANSAHKVSDKSYSAKDIEVLEGLTKGDHTQEMPVRKGILASESDEVGQLSAALGTYKSHLVEMESIREEQA